MLQTLESLKIEFETVDISDPSKEEEKKFMRANSKPAQEGKVPLPPQVFKDDDYCGVSVLLVKIKRGALNRSHCR